MENNFIVPHWPAPNNIRGYTTTRAHGNLARHTGDDPNIVQSNRALLKETLQLPAEPLWLTQTHSTIALQACDENRQREGDAVFTNKPNNICVVLTADCLPILLCNENGAHIAAIHAGWRGLLNGIIESTLQALNYQQHGRWLAWLGPAISSKHFEVGNEVREAFIKPHPEAEKTFIPSQRPEHWLADLYALARLRLHHKGIVDVYSQDFCTYSDAARFYSYRREGNKAGRMATLIWIAES
jgi:YfiH family protein